MRNKNYLFQSASLDNILRSKLREARDSVDRLSEGQFLISTDEEIVENVGSCYYVPPLQLREDETTMSKNETQVDVAGDWRRDLENHRGPYLVPGTQVIVKVPFSGNYELFNYQTNPYSSMCPSAEVIRGGNNDGHLEIVLSAPHDAEPEIFKTNLDQELKLIRACVQRAGNQIEQFNKDLPRAIREAVGHRRGRLQKHSGIAAILNIPLAVNPDAPSITPVKLELVRAPVPLPKPPKNSAEPVPGIKEQDYEHILQLIRHQGRTYETTPGTYQQLGEEDLRNVMLGQLNGHFKGAATGETFRGKGKTDIRIEQDDRAAFVGECKTWSGGAGVTDALDQLLGYLTWRDSKAALIMFNKTVKGFSTVRDSLEMALLAHPLTLQRLECHQPGEWRVLMRSSGDEGHQITLHAFAFNIVDPKLI